MPRKNAFELRFGTKSTIKTQFLILTLLGTALLWVATIGIPVLTGYTNGFIRLMVMLGLGFVLVIVLYSTYRRGWLTYYQINDYGLEYRAGSVSVFVLWKEMTDLRLGMLGLVIQLRSPIPCKVTGWENRLGFYPQTVSAIPLHDVMLYTTHSFGFSTLSRLVEHLQSLPIGQALQGYAPHLFHTHQIHP